VIAAVRLLVGVEKGRLTVPLVQPVRLKAHAVQEVVRDVRPNVDFVEYSLSMGAEPPLLKEEAEDARVKIEDQLFVA
jgi:hypothetical protein